jgi:hypothetical protein
MRAAKLLGIALFTAAAGLAAAVPAHAQVLITIHDNGVSLVAKDATLEQILTEWAKVGQTKIVSSERIPGGPLTLQLTDVPEAQALDILLRALKGYIAVQRASPVAGLSRFERIVVMPTAGSLVPSAASTTPASQADGVVSWERDAEAVPPPPVPFNREDYPADDEVNWTRGPEPVLQPPVRQVYPADDEVNWKRGPEPVAQPLDLPFAREDYPADDEVNWPSPLPSGGVQGPNKNPGTPPAGVAVPGLPASAPVPRQPKQQAVPSDEVVL